MPLYKQPRSPFWSYSFSFRGKRYRATTGKTTKAAAATIEAAALTALTRGEQSITQVRRGVTLREFSGRFLVWVARNTELKDTTRKYYTYGWRLLSFTTLADQRVDAITRDDVKCTTFRRPVLDRRTNQETGETAECSATYANQALRTLKVMLGQAEEWKLIARRPKFAVTAAPGRDQLIDGETEATLQMAFASPTKNARVRKLREQSWLFTVILQDSGMRPNEVYPMRIEHIEWRRNRIWVPGGKTSNAKRFVLMSHRMRLMLEMQCKGRTEGWVFPSTRSKSGHLTTIAKGFQAARRRHNIDSRIVPYSARHTYGTYAMEATKNTFAVSKSMGHADIKSMEPYQHPELLEINAAIDKRNRNRDRTLEGAQPTFDFPESGHTSGHTPPTVQ